jgi:DNA-binding NtrC family response regulator
MAKPNILVVDDEAVVRESLRDWFSEQGYPVDIAASAREALLKLTEARWDILVTDIKMPGMDGLELQARVKKIDPEMAIVIMTAYASIETANQAIREGAYDYVTKPLDPDDLEQIVNRAAERQQLIRENLQLRERIDSVSGETDEIIGESPEIEKVRELIQSAASSTDPVHLIGETGSGKELVAHAVHRASARRQMPLVKVACAELQEDLVEIELFGHEEDALPDAAYQRKGKFELANGGTIFLDEIGDINAKAQGELSRVLEERTITRVGGSERVPVDFLVISASHRDLSQAVEQGSFRGDLYRRVNLFPIHLPPLRERRSDIPLIADYFLRKSIKEPGSARISTAAMKLLIDYPWPGNVRELKNVIERAAVLQQGEEIQPRDLPLGAPDDEMQPSELSLADVEKRHIERVLAQVSGDLSKAAEALRIDELTLNRKLREYGLEAS